MKDKLVILIALVALGLSTYSLMRTRHCDVDDRHFERTTGEGHEKPKKEEDDEDEPKIEVAYYMNHIQRHFNKLYFAGTNENWPLADFYVDELEETMEDIADAGIYEDSVQISNLMEMVGLPNVERIGDAVKDQNKEAFLEAYNTQILQCNKCHTLTKHPYIKIKLPETPALDNQIYTVE